MADSASTAGPGTQPGTLFLVPTPIGNPRDITLRALDVLASVPVIAAEDTRKAMTLLRAHDITARLVSYYDHNEQARSPQLLRLLAGGQDVALITDAGTPLVNDPGYRIVTAAIADGIPVRPLPGPSAVITALTGAGLATHSFHYAGYLPRKSAARRAAAEALARVPATLIFFEAPHRLLESLGDLREVLGDRDAALARNLTKPGEEYLRGPLSQIEAGLAARGEVRGEYTLVVAGAGEDDGSEELGQRLARSLLGHEVAPSVIRDVVRDVAGLSRNDAYELVRRAQDEPRS
jgi:16S rRNA (cytidine1402-2'-O)-methyltransferase